MSEEKQGLGIAEFVAGCLGGFTQVMIGQPFDIVKVRLQTQKVGETLYTGAADCFRKIVKNEGGPLALWRGSLPPLIGVGAATSIQFGVNEHTKSFMQRLTGQSTLSLPYVAVCGAVAGLVNSVVSTPAEHIRIRMQSQGTMPNPPFKSSMDCIKKIHAQAGLRGIYKGGVPTLWREGIAYAVYFSVYDWCIRRMTGNSRHEPEMYKIALSGAFAGICFWFAVFPIDVIKTKIQTDSVTNPQFKSMMDSVRQTYKKQGMNGFWRGLTPCLMRAIPVNSGTFIVYKSSLGLFKPKKDEKLSLL